MSDIKVH